MNGRHPIDDLFARHLRDAEAQPPPAVWEGIARKRGTGRRGLLKRRRLGLAALLLLFLGGAGYWVLAPKEGASGTIGEKAPSVPTASIEQSVTTTPVKEPRATAGLSSPQTTGSGTNPEATQPITSDSPKPEGSTSPTQKPETAQATARSNDAMRTNKRASPKADAKKQTGNTAAVTASAEHNTGATKKNANGEQGPGATSTSDPDQGEGGTNKGASSLSVAENPPVTPSASSIAQPSLKVDRPVRSQADIHLPMLNALISPFSASEVAMLGPILKGDSTPAYVLSKGHWWIAAHGEVAMMNGEWKGTGHEVTELNKVETWQSAQELSLVAGRDWLSGWSVGLGVGVARQRSRFLKRESEPGQTETVIDTTWTGSPQGIATNYTWDIVQTQIYEPGVEHDYSATNTYTKLRIAPEIGYRLLERNRLSLHARLSPVLLLDIGRKGNTLVWTNRSDSLENTTTGTRVMSLGDASLNERFPLAIALSGSVELRYRLCDRWSVSVLPRYTYWLPKADGAIPSLSMNGLGGAVRLRYDLRHNERRVK